MCTNPYFVPSLGFHVPCGQCMACRIDRARSWTERILHEREYWGSGSFVTLTFRDEPEFAQARYSLDVRTLQLFFKRLRYELKGQRISYYACGEYGDRFGAAHYHAIVFGIEPCGECFCCDPVGRRLQRSPLAGTACAALVDAWPSGFVHVSGVGPESAAYVAKYVTKFDSRDLGGRREPFQVASGGLGRRWVVEHAEELWKTKSLRRRGQLYPLPGYYVRTVSRVLAMRPQIGKSLRLLLFDSCRGSCQLVKWMLGRHRWRELREVRDDHRIELISGVHRRYAGIGKYQVEERRQVDRNLVARRSMNEAVRGV